MLENNRILSLIFTFLPALVYAAIIYLRAPSGVIGKRMSQLYFMMGVISGVLTAWFLWAFPNWKAALSNDLITMLLLLSFFQIAVLEEGMKFVLFKATERYRIRMVFPGALMFYCMCVSAGFAVWENVLYLQMYGNEVLLLRAFSAIILHMITGLVMGYFMTLANLFPERRFWYQFLALVVPIFYHGLYDFNVMISMFGRGIQINLILAPGLFIAYFMWKHILTKYPNKR